MVEKRGWVRERIIRILLNEPDGTLTKYRVAKKANCSFSWAHEFLGKLETKELVHKTKVINYAKLVRYWLQVKRKPEKKGYLHKNPLRVIRRSGLQYALTTYQAENLVQNYLFPSRTDLYIIDEDAKRWHELIMTEGLRGDGNVNLLITDRQVLYGTFQKDGLNIVSLPQLIIDLFDEGGICMEAAEKLLEKVSKNAI
jgi:hypothetical protein